MRKKTVLITGCSSGGLGYALAKAFQHENFHIFATARDPTKVVALDDVAETTEWDVLPLDVTSETSIKECLEQVRKKTGNNGLDVLVNNAGGAMFGPLAHASVDEGKALYDVNVWGVLAVAKAFTPLLVEARGVMLNISSMAGAVPLAWQGKTLPYSNKDSFSFMAVLSPPTRTNMCRSLVLPFASCCVYQVPITSHDLDLCANA